MARAPRRRGFSLRVYGVRTPGHDEEGAGRKADTGEERVTFFVKSLCLRQYLLLHNDSHPRRFRGSPHFVLRLLIFVKSLLRRVKKHSQVSEFVQAQFLHPGVFFYQLILTNVIEKGNCTSDDHRLILSNAVSSFGMIFVLLRLSITSPDLKFAFRFSLVCRPVRLMRFLLQKWFTRQCHLSLLLVKKQKSHK